MIPSVLIPSYIPEFISTIHILYTGSRIPLRNWAASVFSSTANAMARGLAIEGAKLKTLTVRKQVKSTCQPGSCIMKSLNESKSIEMGSPIVKYVATSPGSTLASCPSGKMISNVDGCSVQVSAL